jgi:hypothetical protein
MSLETVMALTLAVMALILNALPLLALILAPMLVMTLFYQKQLACLIMALLLLLPL